MQKLTKRQKEVLNFIINYLDQKGYAPSVREIADNFQMKGPRGAFNHLLTLEEKGYIRRQPGAARSIEVIGQSIRETVPVPLVGRVAAGQPILAVENIEGTVPLPRSLARWENTFLLRVQGDSMIESHIQDGDYVLVRPQSVVENGEIAVVVIEDEATVKKFYQQGDFIELHPANPNMKPIRFKMNQADIRVVGKVAAVFRLLDRDSLVVS